MKKFNSIQQDTQIVYQLQVELLPHQKQEMENVQDQKAQIAMASWCF